MEGCLLFIAARILGILGIICVVITYQQKERSKLLLCKLITDCFWLAHYFCLGAYSGAAICVISVMRSTVFLQKGKYKWAESKLWLVFFMICSILSAILTWKNGFTLLTTAVSLCSIISFWIGNPALSRKLNIPIGICMATYAAISGSVEGTLNDSFSTISAIIGIYRLDRKKKQEEGVKDGK